jgi:hypothetical protein
MSPWSIIFCTIVTPDGTKQQVWTKLPQTLSNAEIIDRQSNDNPIDWYLVFKEYFINYFRPVIRGA